MTTPAGWYPDPANTGSLRYWDGQQWTEHRAPGSAASVVEPRLTDQPGEGSAKPWWQRGWVIASTVFVAFLVTVGIASAVAGLDRERDSSAATAATTSPRPSSTPSPTPTPSESSQPSPSPSKSQAALPRVTGYGATTKDWLSAHMKAPGYTDGAAFLPFVKTEESDSQPKYGGVIFEDPIVAYTVFLPRGTSLAEAKLEALAEFPPGASFGRFDSDEPTCLIATIRSKPVEVAMSRMGFEGYVPAVAFETITSETDQLDPRHVTSLQFLPLEDAKDLGDC